jgi:hypothetical protein
VPRPRISPQKSIRAIVIYGHNLTIKDDFAPRLLGPDLLGQVPEERTILLPRFE